MVKHLPPSIKHLLTLRNPNPYPPPNVKKLNAVLGATLQEAERRKARDGWLVLSTCTLLTANTPPAVGDLYRFATRRDPLAPAANGIESSASEKKGFEERLDIAAKMRESAIKCTIFIGVPRVILAFAALTDAFEEDVKVGLRKDTHRMASPDNIEVFKQRGQALWKSIYEPHADKLYQKLGAYHPDFISFIIQSYGIVLSPFPEEDKEQGNLNRVLSSIIGTACLRAETRVVPQLTSHVFGLLKARKEAGSLSEADQWLSSDEGTEWVIRAVDSIYDVARGGNWEDAEGPARDGPRSKL